VIDYFFHKSEANSISAATTQIIRKITPIGKIENAQRGKDIGKKQTNILLFFFFQDLRSEYKDK
jgi:hypothetical protein